MKVCDVIHGGIVTVELGRSDGERFPENLIPKAEVFLLEKDGSELHLQMAEDVWPVAGTSPRDQDSLRQFTTRNLPQLAWFVQGGPGKGAAERILVQFHEFPSAFVWNEPMDIAVDDKVVEDMRKRRRRLMSVEAVVQWLTEAMLLHPRSAGGYPRVLLSGSPAPDAGKRTGFRLYGDAFAVDVERGIDDRLHAVRIVEARRAVEGDERRPIYLATGQLRFCDATVAGQFRGIARTELDVLVAQADSYLGLWKEYNEREWLVILRRARNFGWLSYGKREQLPDGVWRFHLQGDRDRITEYWRRFEWLDGEQIQAGDEVPAAIQGVDSPQEKKGSRKPFVGDLVGRWWSPPSLDLRPPVEHDDRTPPEKGFLFVALAGDEIRIERRKAAWERIRSCTNPMPQLGMIIEGQTVPERRGGRLKPVTKAVRDVFPNPTDRQRLALEVALNTPDIALIQGPPGTGKTRVIAALQARLADKDEGADPDGLSGNTLLTSFQHDAVENAAAATRVMGLPAIKVGFRRGGEESRDGLEVWTTETAQAVRAARASVAAESTVQAALRAVRELTVAYVRSPSSRDEPARVLRRAAELAGPWLPAGIASELGALTARVSVPSAAPVEGEERAFAMQVVRALRTEAVPFADDGPVCAYKALRRLGDLAEFDLSAEEKTTLEEAAGWSPTSPVSDDLLARLRVVRDGLVDRLQRAADGNRGPRTHVDVEDMLVRLVDALTERARDTAPGVEAAVEGWLAALESDPQGVRDTVQHYSMVLAATCQQSVSRAMADAKLGDDTVFRSVVVDEAARSNPLDILIPMALAERRVVLVGDHRQLPHILEPDIEREIERSVREETREQLRRSLFYKLFTELRQREKKDGVKRTVTLNVQYRMHPVLGRFVSEQFYEPYGEGFTSGRPAEDFVHTVALADGISLAGRVAAWIEVLRDRGLESSGRSKSRPCEASRVARDARAIVERHPDLSVGVITFYAAQREELLRQMAELDLTEPDDAGGFRVRDRWQRTADGRERLRVGTVDAFQGMEFDIVFLSLARCNNVEVKDEITRRRRYGFLLLENRLCVAMSRQHRLLIVVGDARMAAGPDAEASIPSLVAFRKLCEGPNGQVVRN
jgi:hypothetical protein